MYDNEYFYNMLRMYSPTAEAICKARWDFVSGVNARTVLDYGSGCGFFKAFAPKGVEIDTFDIMPVPQSGITRTRYDLITFWDVIEHIADLETLRPILDKTDNVAVTVPIKPDGLPWEQYKHYKPGEHIHHFQEDSLKSLFYYFGFFLSLSGTPECPPREMIGSFLFRREK